MQKCWNCGKAATSFVTVLLETDEYREWKDSFERSPTIFKDVKKQRGYCEECAEKEKKKRIEEKEIYVRIKKSLMLERAIKILEKQVSDIYDYREAIKVVEEYSQENPNKFDSAHEMVAAIISIENETETKIGYRISEYTIDLLLTDLKIALEIDGDRHEHTLYKDNERDIAIRRELGIDWEVVRIRTEYVESNAELIIEAAKTIREEKQKIRRANCGILPEWYSRREFSKKPKKKNYGDEILLDQQKIER